LGTVSYNTTTWEVSFAPNSVLVSSETHTLYVYGGAFGVKDISGINMIADYISNFTTGDTIDITRPFGTVVINNNATYTNTRAVVLSLFGTDTQSNIRRIYISNSPTGTDSTVLCDSVTFSSTVPWNINGLTSSDFSAEGNSQAYRIVYVTFEDSAGNYSYKMSDTITLDTLSPEVKEISQPTGNLNNIDRTTNFVVVFNDLMDTYSFVYGTGGSLRLEISGVATLVPATISFQETYIPNHTCPVTMLTVNPDIALNTGTFYRLWLSPSSGPYIKDKASNNLVQKLYDFQTSTDIDATIPDIVNNLRAEALTSTSVKLTWSPVIKNTDDSDYSDTGYYAILRSTTQGAGHSYINRVNGNVTTFIDTTILASTTYYYLVVAVDVSGNTGIYSFEATSKGGIVFTRPSDNSDNDFYTGAYLSREALQILDSVNSRSILITKNDSIEGQNATNIGTINVSFDITPYLLDDSSLVSNFSFAPYTITVTLKYQVEGGLIKGTSISSSEASKYLILAYWNGIQWIRLAGTIDMTKQTITATVNHLTRFAIIFTDIGVFKVLNAEPNPFTPYKAPYDKVVFAIANPDREDMTLKIYDLTGTMVTSRDISGSSASVEWDGKNINDEIVEAGIYVYQIQAGSKFYTGTIIVAR